MQRPMATQRERDDGGKFHIDEVALEARRAEVVKLHADGNTFREIGKRIGINEGTAYRDWKVVMDRTRAEANTSADDERRVSLERINRAIRVLMPMVDAADPAALREAIADGKDAKTVMIQASNALDAMDRLDKLEKRRAALLGLDAPAKQEVTTKASVVLFPPEEKDDGGPGSVETAPGPADAVPRIDGE